MTAVDFAFICMGLAYMLLLAYFTYWHHQRQQPSLTDRSLWLAMHAIGHAFRLGRKLNSDKAPLVVQFTKFRGMLPHVEKAVQDNLMTLDDGARILAEECVTRESE